MLWTGVSMASLCFLWGQSCGLDGCIPSGSLRVLKCPHPFPKLSPMLQINGHMWISQRLFKVTGRLSTVKNADFGKCELDRSGLECHINLPRLAAAFSGPISRQVLNLRLGNFHPLLYQDPDTSFSLPVIFLSSGSSPPPPLRPFHTHANETLKNNTVIPKVCGTGG